MSLVVGHNCPGCGLDTPALACESCGAAVVWDRARGSHCAACGCAASTLTCAQCGLRAELDAHQPERLPLRRGSVAAAAVPWRRLGMGVLVGLHGLVLALLVGGHDAPAPPREPTVAAATQGLPQRLSRGAVQLPLDAMPVPLLLPSPSPSPSLELPPVPTRYLDPPPPREVIRTNTGDSRPPSRETWLQRALRSGRSSGPDPDRLPADGYGIGQ